MYCICGNIINTRWGGKTECSKKPHKRCLSCGSYLPSDYIGDVHEGEVYSKFKWLHLDYTKRDGVRQKCNGKVVTEKEYYVNFMRYCDRFKLVEVKAEAGDAWVCPHCGWYTSNVKQTIRRGHELMHAKLFYYVLQAIYFNDDKSGRYVDLIINLGRKIEGDTAKCPKCNESIYPHDNFCKKCGLDRRRDFLRIDVYYFRERIGVIWDIFDTKTIEKYLHEGRRKSRDYKFKLRIEKI